RIGGLSLFYLRPQRAADSRRRDTGYRASFTFASAIPAQRHGDPCHRSLRCSALPSALVRCAPPHPDGAISHSLVCDAFESSVADDLSKCGQPCTRFSGMTSKLVLSSLRATRTCGKKHAGVTTLSLDRLHSRLRNSLACSS